MGIFALAGCNGASAVPNNPPAPVIAPIKPAVTTPATPVAVKTDRPFFDENKAWTHLVKQCDFGPRPVGSEAHRKTLAYIVTEMKKYADKTVEQNFTYKGLPLTNVIGVFNPESPKQVLILTHWDTRPRAEQELEPANQKKPIIGASDGASGTAVLLELARNLKEKKPDVGVILLFVDGEDYGDFAKDEGVLLGAKYFAKNHDGYHPDYGILLDMVGDKDLDIYRETQSENYAPGTNNKVFNIAAELGYGKYIINRLETNVTDDHIPLCQAGIPTIDLIDFNYKYWHTLDDIPANCSAKSLGIVGNLVAEVIYREKKP